jgi:hypothetical protein
MKPLAREEQLTLPASSILNESPKVNSPMISVAMNNHHLKISAAPRLIISSEMR